MRNDAANSTTTKYVTKGPLVSNPVTTPPSNEASIASNLKLG